MMSVAVAAFAMPALVLGQQPAPASPPAEPLQCLSAPAKPSRLPRQVTVGVETIHRDPERIITIYVPLVAPSVPSKILDTNDRSATGPSPERLIVSDGTVFTAFVGADTQPGSKLDHCLAEIQHRIPAQNPEAALAYLRDRLQDEFLKRTPDHYVFPWDRDRPRPAEELNELFHAAKDLPVGQYPLRSHQSQYVVGLEDFLGVGYGTCLHKALLSHLLLERMGIAHRWVNGATRAVGHTWIELKDGRILDPSLKILARPEPSVAFPGWFKYGDTIAFENQVWPYLELD